MDKAHFFNKMMTNMRDNDFLDNDHDSKYTPIIFVIKMKDNLFKIRNKLGKFFLNIGNFLVKNDNFLKIR